MNRRGKSPSTTFSYGIIIQSRSVYREFRALQGRIYLCKPLMKSRWYSVTFSWLCKKKEKKKSVDFSFASIFTIITQAFMLKLERSMQSARVAEEGIYTRWLHLP